MKPFENWNPKSLVLVGGALGAGVLLLLAAVPSQTDFDGVYFKTNTLPISLTGFLTNWAKLDTNAIGGDTIWMQFNAYGHSWINPIDPLAIFSLGDTNSSLDPNTTFSIEPTIDKVTISAESFNSSFGTDVSLNLVVGTNQNTLSIGTTSGAGLSWGVYDSNPWDTFFQLKASGDGLIYLIPSDPGDCPFRFKANLNQLTNTFEVWNSTTNTFAVTKEGGITTGGNTNRWIFGGVTNGAPDVSVDGTHYPLAVTDSPALTGTPTINGQSMETQLTNKVSKAGDTMTGDLTVPVLQSTKAIRSYQGTLTHAGNTTLNFDAANTVNTMVTTGNCVFVFSGLATNRTYRLRLINSQATNIMLTFPSGIVTITNWSGGYPGTNMTAGSVAMWSMEAWGTTDGDVFNAWGQTQ